MLLKEKGGGLISSLLGNADMLSLGTDRVLSLKIGILFIEVIFN